MKTFYLLFFVVLLLISCKKDKPKEIIPSNPSPSIIYLGVCEEIPPPEGYGFGYDYTLASKVYYASPVCNPYNDKEVIYTKWDENISNIAFLTLYNFETKIEKVIYHDKAFFGGFSWNSKGWIIFNMDGGDIYKIKSNGDSLTKIISGGCYGPEWIDDNRIIFNNGTKCYIINDKGQTLDTINNGSSFFKINGNKLLISGGFNISLYDFITKTEIPIVSGNVIGKADWLDNENIVWADHNAVCKTNINTLITDTLKKVCNSTGHSSTSYSKYLNKLLFRVMLEEKIDSNLIERNPVLTLMDIDGGNEYIFVP